MENDLILIILGALALTAVPHLVLTLLGRSKGFNADCARVFCLPSALLLAIAGALITRAAQCLSRALSVNLQTLTSWL